jgi:hypothetical protein
VQAVLAYAAQMKADPSALLAHYHWQVPLLLGSTELVVPEGYSHSQVQALAAS